MLEKLQNASVFVLNTRYEGLSHILLEALSCGVPVVTTKVGGNLEVINDLMVHIEQYVPKVPPNLLKMYLHKAIRSFFIQEKIWNETIEITTDGSVNYDLENPSDTIVRELVEAKVDGLDVLGQITLAGNTIDYTPDADVTVVIKMNLYPYGLNMNVPEDIILRHADLFIWKTIHEISRTPSFGDEKLLMIAQDNLALEMSLVSTERDGNDEDEFGNLTSSRNIAASFLKNCPIADVNQYMFRALNSFFYKTQIYQETLEFTIEQGVNEYALPDLDHYRIGGIRFANIQDWNVIEEITFDEVTDNFKLDNTKFKNYIGMTMKVVVFLVPYSMHAIIPRYIAETYADGIIAGTVMNATQIPNKEYSNISLSQRMNEPWIKDIRRAKDKILRDNKKIDYGVTA